METSRSDERKTKKELIRELQELRKQLEHSPVSGSEKTVEQEPLQEWLHDHQALLEDHAAVMYLGDPDSLRILYANRAACEFYGYDLETFLSKTIPAINTLPEEEIRKHIQITFENKNHYFEFRHRLSNGEVKDVEIRSAPVYIGENKQAFFAIVHDISKRKALETARLEAEKRFKIAFHTSPDAIAIHRLRDGVCVDVNEGFINLTGFKRKEVVEQPGSDIQFWCNLEIRSKLIKEILTKGRVNNLETLFCLKNKEKRTGLVSARVIHVHNEPHVLTIIRDIENWKKDQEALKESEAKYRTIVDNALVAIYITQDHTLKFCNQRFAEMFGFANPQEAVGVHVSKIISSRSWDMVDQEVRRRENGSKEYSHYFFYGMRADGSEFEVEAYGSRINYQGKPAVHGVLIDVSRQRQLEQQLRQAQKMEAIGTLAGGIAHDFNNILGAIIGYTELSLSCISPEERTRDFLNNVLKAADRAKNLVQQILTFSRQHELERKAVRVTLIVKEALHLLRSSLPATIEIRKHICDAQCMVFADPTQIHQVLMNLCTNAAHAMREKGGVLSVSLEEVVMSADDTMDGKLKAGHYLRLNVVDTGKGIPPAIKERIFEPYFTTKSADEGTGLGLAMVHGIIRGLNGHIEVESEVGTGTTFTAYLPVIKQENVLSSDSLDAIPTGNEKIMFLDDEESLADLGKQMLEQLGYRVVARTSSEEALATFKQDPCWFDLVISDQTMPRMTGKDLAQELVKIRKDIPIIICSGFSEIISQEQAASIGIAAFVMKPLVKKDLATIVRNVLDMSKKTSEED
jgi:PAS domain S-box-containing protein